MAEIDLPANALVVGLARSGQAAARALVRHGVTVLAVDRNEELDAGRLRAEGVEVRLGADDPALLDGMDLLVKSPGVPAEAPIVAAARERALPVWSEVELGYRLLPNSDPRRHRHERQDDDDRAARRDLPRRRPARRGRRERRPPADGARRREPARAPGSSASCRASSSRTSIASARRSACLLNVTPDHLDRHGDMGRYEAAKLRLFENQEGGDTAVVPDGLPARSPARRHARRVLRRRRAARRAAPFPASTTARMRPRRPPQRAPPGSRTTRSPRACAVSPASRTALETVRELDGVRYVNDSKATNPEAAERALTAFPGAGLPRDPRRLAQERRLLRSGPIGRRSGECRRAYLIGESADEIAPALAAAGVDFAESGDLATAVGEAAAAERSRATSCCSRPRARASTSSATTRTVETASAPWWSSCEAPEDETSSTTCSFSSRSAWSRSGSSWSTAQARAARPSPRAIPPTT